MAEEERDEQRRRSGTEHLLERLNLEEWVRVASHLLLPAALLFGPALSEPGKSLSYLLP